MTTQEHLNKIKAKCEQLLELAAKRTPGKWIGTNLADVFTDTEDAKRGVPGHHIADCDPSCDKTVEAAKSDRNFIISCAGPAEAGWRATIAAIDGIEAFFCAIAYIDPSSSEERESRIHMVIARDSILAAWPEELL